MGSVNQNESKGTPQTVISPDIAPLRRTVGSAREAALPGMQINPASVSNTALELFAGMFDPQVLQSGSESAKKFDPTGPQIALDRSVEKEDAMSKAIKSGKDDVRRGGKNLPSNLRGDSGERLMESWLQSIGNREPDAVSPTISSVDAPAERRTSPRGTR